VHVTFSVTFELLGAKPEHKYAVGAHLFNKNNLSVYPSIKSFLGQRVNKFTISREETKAATESGDFSYLTTDKKGNGKTTFEDILLDDSYRCAIYC
jgi:hypothetical protein